MEDEISKGHVSSYDAYRLGRRENLQPEGFDFDMDTFEDLVDAFTTEADILVILNQTREQMNRFCRICYNGADFATVYRQLLAISGVFRRKYIDAHAKNGHSFAMGLEAKYWLGMNDEPQEQNLNITIKNDLKP